jgi:hypothetical protein
LYGKSKQVGGNPQPAKNSKENSAKKWLLKTILMFLIYSLAVPFSGPRLCEFVA